jgi:8-oxo-dGTP pyrophosphatase MutT (NUDIX family)
VYAGDRAEFWVVEDTAGEKPLVVGTAALKRHGGDTVVEIRKMYLDKAARGVGLGGFLLAFCEERARQLGYVTAYVETASVLFDACALYERAGYILVEGVDTPRCDMALSKDLLAATKSEATSDEERVVIVDEEGCLIAHVSREKAQRRRLLYSGIAVLVLSRDGKRAFVQRRSMKKINFPGALDLFVAGAVAPGESAFQAARRELGEELGLDADRFEWEMLYDGLHIVDCREAGGDRCSFTAFIARSADETRETDISFADGEVDEGFYWTREQVDESSLLSPIWKFVRSLESKGGLCGGKNRAF